MSRPDGFGVDVTIDSIEAADKALHELGWLRTQLAALEGRFQQKIEALKKEFDQAAVVTIEANGEELEEIKFADRIKLLQEKLEEWTAAHIGEHLDGKRTVTLAHGNLGFRQLPLCVVIASDEETAVAYKPKDVLGWIGQYGWFSPAQRRLLTKTKVDLHLAGAKDALSKGKVTREDLWQVGIDVIDERDIVVVEPSEVTVTAEAA